MISLRDPAATRRYLTEAEPARLLAAADCCEREGPAFCHALAWSDCR